MSGAVDLAPVQVHQRRPRLGEQPRVRHPPVAGSRLVADELATPQCRAGQAGPGEFGVADLGDPDTALDQRLEHRAVRLPGQRVGRRIPPQLVEQHATVGVHHLVADQAVPSGRQPGSEGAQRCRRGARAARGQGPSAGRQRGEERSCSGFLLQQFAGPSPSTSTTQTRRAAGNRTAVAPTSTPSDAATPGSTPSRESRRKPRTTGPAPIAAAGRADVTADARRPSSPTATWRTQPRRAARSPPPRRH